MNRKNLKILQQTKEKQKNIDMSLFKKVFNYKTPDQMLQTLDILETAGSYNQAASSIEDSFEDFGDEVKALPRSDEKNKGIKLLNITNKILNFSLKKQKQKGQGLKILTPNQMLSRLLISLAQLKAGNDSEKLKNKIRQITKNIYKSLVDII